jgi:hypothetical protein
MPIMVIDDEGVTSEARTLALASVPDRWRGRAVPLDQVITALARDYTRSSDLQATVNALVLPFWDIGLGVPPARMGYDQETGRGVVVFTAPAETLLDALQRASARVQSHLAYHHRRTRAPGAPAAAIRVVTTRTDCMQATAAPLLAIDGVYRVADREAAEVGEVLALERQVTAARELWLGPPYHDDPDAYAAAMAEYHRLRDQAAELRRQHFTVTRDRLLGLSSRVRGL